MEFINLLWSMLDRGLGGQHTFSSLVRFRQPWHQKPPMFQLGLIAVSFKFCCYIIVQSPIERFVQKSSSHDNNSDLVVLILQVKLLATAWNTIGFTHSYYGYAIMSGFFFPIALG